MYGNNTGTFTSPYNGTYFFVAATGTNEAHKYVSLDLVVEGAVVSGNYGYGTGSGYSVSVHAVVHLLRGQRAWLKSDGGSFRSEANTFSGFLVSPDP